MKATDLPPASCTDLPASARCDASLADSPQCAPNYHFGMLLGVDDFRAEQGFHVGRLRRHQRLLHGAGVVAGFAVSFDDSSFELKVGPGYGIDVRGRDLMLDDARCVNLALWWARHAADEDYADVEPGVTRFDVDVVACYANCLDRPVPAIAEPCAGDAADIAHSRICETVTLALVRHRDHPPPPTTTDYHLLRLWLGLEPVAVDAEGKPHPDDQWLLDARATLAGLPVAQQASARAALIGELTARAVAATAPFAPAGDEEDNDDEADTCLILARLRGLRFTADGADAWTVDLEALELGARTVLLPTRVLQATAGAKPPPAGPVVATDGASVAGTTVTLVFTDRLAAASVTTAAFAVSEFVAASGWALFAPVSASYDESDPAQPTVTLTLDRAPVGERLRITTIGSGSTPLLGHTLIPAGARDAERDGRNLTTTLSI